MPIPGETGAETKARKLKDGLLELMHKIGMIRSDKIEWKDEELLAMVRKCRWLYLNDDYLADYFSPPEWPKIEREEEIPF